MSKAQAQTSSGKSYNRAHGRYKRGHDNNTDGDDGVSSSRYQRTLTEEEKNDFVNYQKEMDERRDRYERIVKLSRDVIIECKRIIFQLHRTVTVNTSEDKGLIGFNFIEKL
ncbi:unnamed protein product [Onchocerca flexuosa]|uniref:ADP-ribosylation factor-like protein 6-interacting protein 4 n=1 Tax=Onchocerca flexuosa TaxID=387005 RepID=A0A183I664_9BILA|nr:unnamed protein product [Onchocerca flexuosa]